MPGPTSAYAALGLEPGADRAAIEEAYRRLIKRYHPDRSGGDATRAAEINRAYFELRQPPERLDHRSRPSDRSETATRRVPGRSRRRGARPRRRSPRLWPLVAAGAGLLLLLGGDRLVEGIGGLSDLPGPALASRGSAVQADSTMLDGPLREAVISTAVREARALANRGDAAALAQQSRACHRRMRSRPELAQLDRCAAFDNTVAALADPDPIYDRGPFSASAVTSRLMTAASLLSSDYLAIERRLDRIRTTVELSLRPPLPSPPPPVVADEAEPGADDLTRSAD